MPKVNSDTGFPDPKGRRCGSIEPVVIERRLRIGLGEPLLADQLRWAQTFDKAMEILHLLGIGFGVFCYQKKRGGKYGIGKQATAEVEVPKV